MIDSPHRQHTGKVRHGRRQRMRKIQKRDSRIEKGVKNARAPFFIAEKGGRCRVCHCGLPHRHDNYTVPVTETTPTQYQSGCSHPTTSIAVSLCFGSREQSVLNRNTDRHRNLSFSKRLKDRRSFLIKPCHLISNPCCVLTPRQTSLLRKYPTFITHIIRFRRFRLRRSRSQLRSQQLLWFSARRLLTYAAGFRSGRCVFNFFRFFCYERERNIPAYNTPPDNFFILAILVSSTFTAVLTTEKFMPKKHLLHCEILTL